MTVISARAGRLDRRRIGFVAAGVLVLADIIAIVLVQPGDDVFGVAIAGYGAVAYTFVGVVVLWRRPGHGIGRLALAVGLAFALGGSFTTIARVGLTDADPSTWPAPVATVLETTLNVLIALPIVAMALGVSLLITWFPDGRRTSRMGGVVEILLAASVLLLIAGAVGFLPNGTDLAIVALVGSIVLSLVDLVNRYRGADPQRRTQMRWVLAAMTVTVVLLLMTIGPASSDPRLDWVWTAWLASNGLPILAIAIAITRYHLYDIDRIVSRSIAYVVVSIVLFALFNGVNLGLQAMISPLFNGTSIAVAASTLVVAASFAPVARAVQRVVDRRFNRSRHDADGVVAAFGGRLRDELDLHTVAEELQGTASRTVEPSATAVWLRSRPGP
jgi:hypothetical protein